MNNQPIVRPRSLRMTAGKHPGSNNTNLYGSATAPCISLDRCSRRDSTSPIHGVVPPTSMQSHAAYQSGAVLVISLIMLLLLTLIGTSAMQSTSLEEKMAGNMRDENLAFQAAETALRAGESIVTLNPPAFSIGSNGTGGTGLYTTIGANPPDPSGFWKTVSWNSATTVATYTGGALSHVNSVPRYIIEELLTTNSSSGTTNTGGSLEAGSNPTSQTVSWYRITARGTGASDNAVVLLQSIYKR